MGKKRNPDAPKRPLSSYMIFVSEKRASFKESNPDLSFGELGKVMGKAWGELSADDKKPFEDTAATAKTEYALAMENFKGKEFLDEEEKDDKKKKKKSTKDPNAPKKARSGFMWFSQDMRPDVVAKYPDMSFVDIGKRLGEMWKTMTDVEKAPYQKQYDDDKARWEKEMAEYKTK